MNSTHALELMARLAACDDAIKSAMQVYILPYTIQQQELLGELGAALSGFAIGDVIYCDAAQRAIKITGFSAAITPGGSYYWLARGIGPTGQETAFGIVPDKWRLVPDAAG